MGADKRLQIVSENYLLTAFRLTFTDLRQGYPLYVYNTTQSKVLVHLVSVLHVLL